MNIGKKEFLGLVASLACSSVLAFSMLWISMFNSSESFGKSSSDRVELDGVVIATPLDEHVEPAEALEKGIHVFCEKSMARTLDDVKQLDDAHIEHDKILLIGHRRLYSPIYWSQKRV